MIDTIKVYAEMEYKELTDKEKQALKNDSILALLNAIIDNQDKYIKFDTYSVYNKINCRAVKAEICIEKVGEICP